jgi:hypothetical protein
MCPNDEKSARNEFLEAVSGGSITSELRNRVRNSQIGLCEASSDSIPQFIWGMSVIQFCYSRPPELSLRTFVYNRFFGIKSLSFPLLVTPAQAGGPCGAAK